MHDPYTPLGVSEAITVFNETLAMAHPAVLIDGEVASFKVNHNKFAFFDIKDETSSLGCFMMAFQLKFPLEDGMRVRVLAEPKLTAWGKFSLTVREVLPIGEGSLRKAFELLKNSLAKEGLFDTSRKRPLPDMPIRIGVVSSEQAAGWVDFQKILQQRWAGLRLVLAHVPVQGVEAPRQIVGAIQHLNELPEPVDIIALIRGGGSLDDLAAFNHEDVVRAVASSRAPTITGIGHETDTSLADLAADMRAATPSNAAELLVPDKTQVWQQAQSSTVDIEKAIRSWADTASEQVHVSKDRAGSLLDTFFDQKRDTLQAALRTLRQLNPESILKKGYSLVKKDGRLVARGRDVTIGDDITIQFSDGEIGASVTNAKA